MWIWIKNIFLQNSNVCITKCKTWPWFWNIFKHHYIYIYISSNSLICCFSSPFLYLPLGKCTFWIKLSSIHPYLSFYDSTQENHTHLTLNKYSNFNTSVDGYMNERDITGQHLVHFYFLFMGSGGVENVTYLYFCFIINHNGSGKSSKKPHNL